MDPDDGLEASRRDLPDPHAPVGERGRDVEAVRADGDGVDEAREARDAPRRLAIRLPASPAPDPNDSVA